MKGFECGSKASLLCKGKGGVLLYGIAYYLIEVYS